MRHVILCLVVLSVVACGDDGGKKVVTACAADADCLGGVCFESACYTACTDAVDPCGVDEACVLKTRADGDVALCVAAASIQCVSHDDCAEVHSRECLHAKCDPDTLRCIFAELPDHEACFDYDVAGTGTAGGTGDMPLLPENAAGVCFHGVCRKPCSVDNDCPDVCALAFTGDGQLYCVNGADLVCGDGFPAEFSDACSSVWTREGGTCEFNTSAEGPSTVPAEACDLGATGACITEGCTRTCVSDADCGDGRCVGFYSYDSLPDDTAIGFFKACR
jgi:hypothetical protein